MIAHLVSGSNITPDLDINETVRCLPKQQLRTKEAHHDD